MTLNTCGEGGHVEWREDAEEVVLTQTRVLSLTIKV